MAESLSKSPRTKVFISYSHEDAAVLARLQVHLDTLNWWQRETDLWVDTRIKPGGDWKEEVKGALDAAKVAVLLVSADFLRSSFIRENELPPLLEAVEREGVIVLPVIVGPCLFTKIEALSRFQSVNPPSRPLSKMTKAQREAVYNDVAEAIHDAMDYPMQEIVATAPETAQSARETAIPVLEPSTGPPAAPREYVLDTDAVKFLLDNRLTRWELEHLRHLHGEGPVRYKPRYSFQQELRRLLTSGLIERHENKGVRMAMNDTRPDRDLKDYLYVTDKGERYLAYLAQIDGATAPAS